MSKQPAVIAENRNMPMLALRGTFLPESIDEEARTVRVQYTTGARVYRAKYWEEDYYEELSTEKGHVRLERMKGGAAPVLNSHRSWDLKDVLGRIIDADETHCTMRFSERDDVKGIWQDIRTGILGNVSVGYFVHRYADVTPDGDKTKVLRAIDWEPFEVSVVPVGADAGAGIRSQQTNHCTIVDERAANIDKGQNMDKDLKDQKDTRGADPANPAPAATPAPAPAATPPAADTRSAQEVAQAAVAAERTRSAEIRSLVASVGLASEVADGLVNDGSTIEQARKLVLDKLATADESTEVRSHVRITKDERDTQRAAMENYLEHRANPSAVQLTDAARQFRGMTLLEMVREYHGHRETRGMTKMEIAGRAFHSTSDFGSLLANVASKSLRKGYGDTKRTFTPFTRQVTLPDFKTISRVALSNGPSMKQVVEGAEYEYGTFGDGAETYRLFTYGRIVAITREAIVNDDLDGFTRVPQKMAAASARLENRMVYDILTGNPVMADGTALFHANHGNLTAAVLGVDGLGTVRALMRVQKDPSGEDVLNYEGKYLIVPAALELKAAQLKAQITAAKASDTNPFASSLEVIVEPYLDATSTTNYFVSADPNEADTIEYAYLDGQTGPYMETRDGFSRDGLEIKVRHDFATKAVDHRGLVKSTNTP